MHFEGHLLRKEKNNAEEIKSAAPLSNVEPTYAAKQEMQNYHLSLVIGITLSSTNYFSIYFTSESESIDLVMDATQMHTLIKRDLTHISLT